MSFSDFAGSYVLVRTTERAILVIAEAVKALPLQMTARHPDIEWHAIRGMGNILRHEYQNVDAMVLWRVVKRSLPDLSPVIERMIGELDAEAG